MMYRCTMWTIVVNLLFLNVLLMTKMVGSTVVSSTKLSPIATPVGIVVGALETVTNTKFYVGLPYATAGRWKEPVPAAAFVEPYEALTAKSMCPQPPCADPIACVTVPPPSEDCLYLNVYTPADASPTNRKAVMFWIHGGAFTYFGGGALLYSGHELAKSGDVVVVTINYRLGIFGFLATGTDSSDIKGNLGIMDQRMAMQWVHDNIAAFGGDPDRVTLFGQSAGAQSIGVHLTNPNAAPLFHGSIMISAPISIPFRTLADTFFQTEMIALNASCTIGDKTAMITCLKLKSVAELVAAQSIFIQLGIEGIPSELITQYQPFGPTVDGVEVLDIPINAFCSRLIAPNKPVILGTTSEEAVFYILGDPTPLPYVNFLSFVRGIFVNRIRPPPEISELTVLYPLVSVTDSREALAQASTDYVFTCPNRYVANLIERHTQGSSWVYLFDQAVSINEVWGDSKQCYGRACHAVDLTFIFNTPSALGYLDLPFDFTTAEADLSANIIRYFSNFAKTGNPNTPVAPQKLWEGFDTSKHIIFKTGALDMDFVSNSQGAQCNLWEEVGFFDYSPISYQWRTCNVDEENETD